MEIAYSPDAQKDLEWWRLNGDESSKNKITRLIQEISEHPKQEPENQKHFHTILQDFGQDESIKKTELSIRFWKTKSLF